jgi:hypothetical protein
MNPTLRLLCGGLLALQLSSCADIAARVRRHTYPPTFYYITDEQLRSAMWRLAYHSRELRELMTPVQEASAHRGEILRHLRVMEQTAVDLNRSGWPSNHPLIDANRANLLQDIRIAQAAINRDPPNFLLAGSVSGACFYCHPHR